MKTSTVVWIIILILIIGGVWWYVASENTTQPVVTAPVTTTTNVQSTTTEAAAMPTLSTATDAKLGAYLTGTNGMTLYTYTKDTAGVSNCTGACATNWPPYTVSAAPVANVNITGTASSITRSDGSIQVTYNGMPLYFWSGDAKVGDITGNGVGGFVVAKP